MMKKKARQLMSGDGGAATAGGSGENDGASPRCADHANEPQRLLS